jgi:hypothetical protein
MVVAVGALDWLEQATKTCGGTVPALLRIRGVALSHALVGRVDRRDLRSTCMCCGPKRYL